MVDVVNEFIDSLLWTTMENPYADNWLLCTIFAIWERVRFNGEFRLNGGWSMLLITLCPYFCKNQILSVP